MAIGKLVQKDGRLLYSSGDLWSADDATSCNCNCDPVVPYTCSCNVGSFSSGFNLSGSYTVGTTGLSGAVVSAGSIPDAAYTLCKNDVLHELSHEREYFSVTRNAASIDAVFDCPTVYHIGQLPSYNGVSALNVAPYNSHYHEPQLRFTVRDIGATVDILVETISSSTGAVLFSQSGYTFPFTIKYEYIFFLIGNDYYYTLTNYVNGASVGQTSGRWYAVFSFPAFPPTAITTSLRPCNFLQVNGLLAAEAAGLDLANVIDVDWTQTVTFS